MHPLGGESNGKVKTKEHEMETPILGLDMGLQCPWGLKSKHGTYMWSYSLYMNYLDYLETCSS